MNHTMISGTIKDITYSWPIDYNTVWHHVALTYSKSSGIVKLYIDGNLKINTTYYNADLSNNNPIYFGRYFIGNIDEVAIYPKLLNQSTIQEHMKSPASLENVFIEI